MCYNIETLKAKTPVHGGLAYPERIKMSQDNYIVYGIENTITSKWYIGQTSAPETRKNQHFNLLKRNTHENPKLQHAFNKHGYKVFKWYVLDNAETLEEVLDLEAKYIEQYNSFHDGYNQTQGYEDYDYMSISCEWNGVQYPSITAAAEDIGIDVSAMRRRLIKGQKCDDDMPYKNPKFRPVSWNGVQYSSVKIACEILGMPTTTLSNYIDRGYTCDTDIPDKHPNAKSFIWEDVEYESGMEAARQLNVSYNTIKRWKRKGYQGYSDVRPVGNQSDIVYQNSKSKKPVIINGVKYESRSEAARQLNVNASTIINWLKKGKATNG